MKRFLALMLGLALCIGVLSGCGSKEEVVIEDDTEVIGTWSEDFFDSGYIFNEDLTGTDTFWDLTFTYTAQEGIITITYDDEIWGSVSYEYVVNGEYLTMTRISEVESGEDVSSYTYTKVTEEETEEDDASDKSDESDESGDDEDTAEDETEAETDAEETEADDE